MTVEHGNPFDRMPAAQAEIEGLHRVTRDPVFDAFDVELVVRRAGKLLLMNR